MLQERRGDIMPVSFVKPIQIVLQLFINGTDKPLSSNAANFHNCEYDISTRASSQAMSDNDNNKR
eukprot:scaffold155351_cov19-Prasinocladus_malaysianus.AAC.2